MHAEIRSSTTIVRYLQNRLLKIVACHGDGESRCIDDIHVCFVQVTIWNIFWRSRHSHAPRCAHFPTDICCLIQEGVK